MILKERPREMAVFYLLILFLIFYFGFKPLIKTVRTANLERAVNKEELVAKEERLNILNLLKSNSGTAKEELLLMEKALPKGEDTAGLLVSLEALIGHTGLSASSIAPVSTTSSTDVAGADIGELFYGLNLHGSYPLFLAFLENLEKNIRPLSVSKIALSGGGGGQPLSINLTISAYYQK